MAIKQHNYFVKKQVKVEFEWNGTDSSGVANSTVAAHGTGVYLPDNAIVTNCFYDVLTTFVDADNDSATIALSIEGAGDLKAAIAISDASDVWNLGLHGCLPGNWALTGDALTAIAMAAGRSGAFVKTSAERELTVTVADDALTAGKMIIYLEYVISE